MYIDPSFGGALGPLLGIIFTAVSGVILIFSNKIKMFFSKGKRSSDIQPIDEIETEPQDE